MAKKSDPDVINPLATQPNPDGLGNIDSPMILQTEGGPAPVGSPPPLPAPSPTYEQVFGGPLGSAVKSAVGDAGAVANTASLGAQAVAGAAQGAGGSSVSHPALATPLGQQLWNQVFAPALNHLVKSDENSSGQLGKEQEQLLTQGHLAPGMAGLMQSQLPGEEKDAKLAETALTDKLNSAGPLAALLETLYKQNDLNSTTTLDVPTGSPGVNPNLKPYLPPTGTPSGDTPTSTPDNNPVVN